MDSDHVDEDEHARALEDQWMEGGAQNDVPSETSPLLLILPLPSSLTDPDYRHWDLRQSPARRSSRLLLPLRRSLLLPHFSLFKEDADGDCLGLLYQCCLWTVTAIQLNGAEQRGEYIV